MQPTVTIILFSIGLFLSFLSGFYTALYFQGQLQVFGHLGGIIPFFAPIGSIVVLLKLFSDWYNQPTLEFNGIYVKKIEYFLSDTTGKKWYQQGYFLTVKKKRGHGNAENCEGFLEVKGTDIQQYTVWESGLRYTNIGIEDRLKLFEIREYVNENQQNVIFYSNLTNLTDPPIPRSETYNHEFANNVLSIRLGVSKGKTPSKQFISPINSIVSKKDDSQ